MNRFLTSNPGKPYIFFYNLTVVAFLNEVCISSSKAVSIKHLLDVLHRLEHDLCFVVLLIGTRGDHFHLENKRAEGQPFARHRLNVANKKRAGKRGRHKSTCFVGHYRTATDDLRLRNETKIVTHAYGMLEREEL